MLRVERVLRRCTVSCRVILSDGRLARLPIAVVDRGVVESDDVVQLQKGMLSDWVWKGWVHERRKPRVPALVRDMSNFDSIQELGLLRSIVYKNRRYIHRALTPEFVDDLASDLFLHFWERNFFQGYDPRKCASYKSYISRGVRNWLIDRNKRKSVRYEDTCVSLDSSLTKDSDFCLLDNIGDTRFTPEQSQKLRDFAEACHRLAERMDIEVGTGIDVDYSTICKYMVDGTGTLNDLVACSRYSQRTVSNRWNLFLEKARPFYKEFIC